MRIIAAATCWILLIANSGFGHAWQGYGPTDITVNNCYFHTAEPYYSVLCTSDSLLIDDDMGWHAYSYSDLSIWDAYHLNADTLIVVLGDSSWSDGIWAFNRQIGQFEILEWCFIPHFVMYSPAYATYYVGFGYGLMKSTDGISWDTIEYFDWIDCVSMACFGNHIVVSGGGQIFYSDDGITWNNAIGPPIISDMVFLDNGMLYGIFPDNSYSSGLWSSEDYGMTWNVEFWDLQMTSVGKDSDNTLFVGWHDPVTRSEGIAIWVPELEDLTFINEGLPERSINKIKTNHLVDCPSVICCTENGVFYVTAYLYPPIVSADRVNSTTGRLTWNIIPGAATYDFYRHTSPYFSAAETPWLTVSELPPELEFTCGIGDENTNYYFLEIACDSENQESHESNIVGEFDFAWDAPISTK